MADTSRLHQVTHRARLLSTNPTVRCRGWWVSGSAGIGAAAPLERGQAPQPPSFSPCLPGQQDVPAQRHLGSLQRRDRPPGGDQAAFHVALAAATQTWAAATDTPVTKLARTALR